MKTETFTVFGNYGVGRTAVGKDGGRFVVGSFSQGRLELGRKTRLSSGWDHDETGSSSFLINYDEAGTAAWIRKFDGEPRVNVPFVSTDDGGNVYVAGYVRGRLRVGERVVDNDEYFDVFVAKLDHRGNLLWARFGGNSRTTMYGLAADAAGNTYITGKFEREMRFGDHRLPHSGAPDLFLIKHAPDGRLVWAKQVGGEEQVVARDVAVDAGGNVLVTGYVGGKTRFDGIELDNGGGVFLAKLEPSGAVEWVRGAVGEGLNEGKKIAVSPHGDIYIVGEHFYELRFGDVSIPGDKRTRAFLATYDDTGTVKWARNISEPGQFNLLKDLEAVSTGDVYVLAAFGLLGFTRDDQQIPVMGAPGDMTALAVDARDQLHLTFGRDDSDDGFEMAWAQCRAK